MKKEYKVYKCIGIAFLLLYILMLCGPLFSISKDKSSFNLDDYEIYLKEVIHEEDEIYLTIIHI